MTMTNDGTGVAVGIDGSPRALVATRFGALEARRRAVPLTLVHVVPDYVPLAPMMPLVPEDLRQLGHRLLSEAVKEGRDESPEIEISTQLLTGDPVSELVKTSTGARLMVLGHESATGWSRVFTGAVTMGVAARVRCPVVCVPEGWADGRTRRGSVVVGFKTADHHPDLLEQAFDSAAALDARLTVLHAWELPGCYDDIIVRRTHETEWNLAARKRIEAQVTELRVDHPGVEVGVRVVHRQPAQALREASRAADLLILARRVDGPVRWHLGGTLRALLREASCPVEVVPGVITDVSDEALVLEQAGAPLK